jgi:hypothetical protein
MLEMSCVTADEAAVDKLKTIIDYRNSYYLD